MNITRLPQVDKILRQPALVQLQDRFRRDLLTQLVRDELAKLRAGNDEQEADLDSITASVCRRAEALLTPALRRVINGTGVVLNTNLGRAPLSSKALSELAEIGSGYCNLEIDLSTGKRGKRSHRIAELLRLITGAEAALVVNNNAAAVMLAVNALAKDREVIVSRGELIEIGGSFRLPDVIEAAGGCLREVGTTNRTRIGDYRAAICDRSGLLMRCHRSNFEIRGFTEQVSLTELAALSAQTSVPLLEDLGSGVLLDLSQCGMKDEPTVQEAVATGCDLISFSGDKLLGGPQAGFIVGSKKWVDKLASHAMYRALRLDKLTLALIERTLLSYLSPAPQESIPVLSMLHEPASDIKTRAENFARTICDGGQKKLSCRVVATNSAAGGGSLPGEAMDSFGISIELRGWKTNKLVEKLRSSEPPVIAVVQEDQVILDFRTITLDDEKLLSCVLTKLGNEVE